MLEIKNITKTFDNKIVLDSVTMSLHDEVVALVGNNGAGKSTLFKIIIGEAEQDEGVINSNENIGYLPQEFNFADITVAEFLLCSKPKYEFDIVFHRLGLNHISKNQNILNLSGGEKTKIYLAKILLSDPAPTMLLLDEPTNNLDLEGVYWLEDFILSFDGLVFLSSHDRALLDDVADRIIELDNGTIKQYGGNYTFYREQKEVEKEAYARMYLVQEKKIQKIEEDINTIQSRALLGEKKFGSNNPYQRRKIRKAAQLAVSRKRKLEKFLSSEKRLQKPVDRRSYPFHFEGNTYSNKFVLGMKNVCKRFGEREILDGISFSVFGSQHVWLSGNNGTGKSTVLKMFTGQINPDSGIIEFGIGVRIGYFSQELIFEDNKKNMLEELTSSGAAKTDLYKYAAFLHLNPDDMKKRISELSRGQRTKMEFIKLLMANNHILILDEPTNHLEIDTRQEIEEALNYYEGAILVASHDRYFLERIGIDKQIDMTSEDKK